MLCWTLSHPLIYSFVAQVSILEKVRPYAPNFLLLICLGMVCFFLLRRSGGFLRRRGYVDPAKEVRETRALLAERSRDSELADAPVEVLRWQVEMHATARDLKGELDSKIMTLQALLLEARAEREKLEAALAKSDASQRAAKGTAAGE